MVIFNRTEHFPHFSKGRLRMGGFQLWSLLHTEQEVRGGDTRSLVTRTTTTTTTTSISTPTTTSSSGNSSTSSSDTSGSSTSTRASTNTWSSTSNSRISSTSNSYMRIMLGHMLEGLSGRHRFRVRVRVRDLVA